jgi:hypothetical protein
LWANLTLSSRQFKKASKHVQLKVGHMNVQLFDGPTVLGSWLVAHMSSWEYSAKHQDFILHIKPGGKDWGSADKGAKAQGGFDAPEHLLSIILVLTSFHMILLV